MKTSNPTLILSTGLLYHRKCCIFRIKTSALLTDGTDRGLKWKGARENSSQKYFFSLYFISALLKYAPTRKFLFFKTKQTILFAEKLQKVQFQLAPIDLNLSAANTDDAYDFNTDFKWAGSSELRSSGGRSDLGLRCVNNSTKAAIRTCERI